MKKEYRGLELDVVIFDTDDVIENSGTSPQTTENETDRFGWEG